MPCSISLGTLLLQEHDCHMLVHVNVYLGVRCLLERISPPPLLSLEVQVTSSRTCFCSVKGQLIPPTSSSNQIVLVIPGSWVHVLGRLSLWLPPVREKLASSELILSLNLDGK